MNYIIRPAVPDDAKAVHDIYGAYVDSEHVTFTVTNPDIEAYREKIIKTMKKYPFYVAEDEDGKILGYVCGSELRPHDAYRWNVESTIVLAPDAPRRSGIGSALYKRFEEKLTETGYRHIYAVIVDTNEQSIAFHEKLGYETVGHFKEAGYKLGKWLGIVWMKKSLGNPEDIPREPIPYDMT